MAVEITKWSMKRFENELISGRHIQWKDFVGEPRVKMQKTFYIVCMAVADSGQLCSTTAEKLCADSAKHNDRQFGKPNAVHWLSAEWTSWQEGKKPGLWAHFPPQWSQVLNRSEKQPYWFTLTEEYTPVAEEYLKRIKSEYHERTGEAGGLIKWL